MSMRRAFAGIIAIVLVGFAFGAGYWYRGRDAVSKAEAEDYALVNVLANVGYAYYIEKGDYINLRELVDVNLNDHISRIGRYQGSSTDPAFVESKIRTLNAAAILWEEHPPFTSSQWQPSQSNESWLAGWKDIRERNTQLLSWAKQQCSTNPSLQCKAARGARELRAK